MNHSKDSKQALPDEAAMQAELAALRAKKKGAAATNGSQAKDHIEIIPKGHYDDALFDSEEDLVKDLESSGLYQATASDIAQHDESSEKPSASAEPSASREESSVYQEPSPVKDTQVKDPPIKNDYADYEIDIEAKTDYDDALFDSDEAVDDALKAGKLDEPSSLKSPIQNPKDGLQVQDKKTEPIIITDFSKFIDVLSSQALSKEPEESTVSINPAGINQSPVLFYQQSLTVVGERPFIDMPILDDESVPLADKLPEPKTLAEKIKQKALIQTEKAKSRLGQSKANLDEYFGRTLPERELLLDFKFSMAKVEKDEAGHHFSVQQVDKFFALKKTIYTLMEKTVKELEFFSHTKMLDSTRLKCLEAYEHHLLEHIHAVVATFQRKPSIPAEAEKRVALAFNALTVIKFLLQGYKQVYADIYESNNALYGPRREMANRVACHILDLLCLEMHLSMSAKHPLPASSIKAFNKIFFALALYEPQVIEEEINSVSINRMVSIKDLFKYYQLMITIDGISLSAKKYKLLSQFIDDQLSIVQLVPFGSKPDESKGFYVIDHDTSFPARNVEKIQADSTDKSFPSIYINFSLCFNEIKKQYGEVLSSSSIYSIDKDIELLSALNARVSLLEAKKNKVAYSLYQSSRLKACSGFDNCVHYFLNSYAHHYRKIGALGKDEEIPQKPPLSRADWYCASEDDVFIYLKTNEAKNGIYFDVGTPILFERRSEEKEGEVEELVLGLITDIERGREQTITLVVRKLGHQMTVVNWQDDKEKQQHGLLCFDGSSEKALYLASPPIDKNKVNKKVDLTLPDRSVISFVTDSMDYHSQYIQLSSSL